MGIFGLLCFPPSDRVKIRGQVVKTIITSPCGRRWKPINIQETIKALELGPTNFAGVGEREIEGF